MLNTNDVRAHFLFAGKKDRCVYGTNIVLEVV